MVEHQSKEVVDRMSDELKIQPALALPRKIVDNIQPVFEVSKKHATFARSVITGAAGVTLLSADPNRDTFLTAVSLATIKDAGATSTGTRMELTIGGETVDILAIPGITGTAQSGEMALSFNPPLKIDLGTAITVVNNTAVAVVLTNASACGYKTDRQ